MKLHGPAEEHFVQYLRSEYLYYVDGSGRIWVDDLTQFKDLNDSLSWGVFVDFFASVDIEITEQQYPDLRTFGSVIIDHSKGGTHSRWDVVHNTTCQTRGKDFEKRTREEAREEAVELAVKRFNSRFNG